MLRFSHNIKHFFYTSQVQNVTFKRTFLSVKVEILIIRNIEVILVSALENQMEVTFSLCNYSLLLFSYSLLVKNTMKGKNRKTTFTTVLIVNYVTLDRNLKMTNSFKIIIFE